LLSRHLYAPRISHPDPVCTRQTAREKLRLPPSSERTRTRDRLLTFGGTSVSCQAGFVCPVSLPPMSFVKAVSREQLHIDFNRVSEKNTNNTNIGHYASPTPF